MNNNVYFISGLGADKRAFQFLDLSFCTPVFVEWIKPLPGESIANYALRIKEQITDDVPIIVGLSFGGMVAAEIATLFPVKKLILISSAKTEKEIPFYLRWLRFVPMHKAVSVSFLRSANHLVYRLMGIEKRNDKIIFEEMFYNTDKEFIKWAINQIVNWRNNHVFVNTVHIHGTADILLPHRYIHANYSVKGGEHLMLMTKADIISNLLKQIICDL
ncbi:MAG: alpha/beta hydrolase [Sediminibacterium sp.]